MAVSNGTQHEKSITDAWSLIGPELEPGVAQEAQLVDPFDGLNLDDLISGGDGKVKKKKKKMTDASLLDPTDQRILSSASDIKRSHEVETLTADELCQFRYWDRTAYITYCDATLVEFSRYLWLLQHAQPECWYQPPSQVSTQPPQTDQRAATQQSSLVLMNAEPSALSCPRVCIAKALSTGTVVNAQHTDSRHPLSKSGTLRFLSVVQAAHRTNGRSQSSSSSHYPHFDDTKSGSGVPVFKLVVTGSRENAITQAFYDAGAKGWSTVFTCVVFDQGLVEYSASDLGPESVRVSSLAALTELNEENKDARLVMF